MTDDDTAQVSVEATGETVGEAKWKALRDLERLAPGLDKSSVEFQVVSEGERGLLGVGYTPARVVATTVAGSLAASRLRATTRAMSRRTCASSSNALSARWGSSLASRCARPATNCS